MCTLIYHGFLGQVFFGSVSLFICLFVTIITQKSYERIAIIFYGGSGVVIGTND